MELVTIHDLSREFNIPARVIRYRLLQLITEGKLKEPDDCQKTEYKDEKHYVWKINPARFIQETGLKSAMPLPTKIEFPVTNPVTMDNNADNQPPPLVNQGGNDRVTKSDTKAAVDSLAREMIDILKNQIGVKDGQIQDLSKQVKETHELNRVREVTANGLITTVAGIGTPGYFGDGGAATSARLNAPRALALDAFGNLFITDFGNSRV